MGNFVAGFVRQCAVAVLALLALTVLLGGLYPVAVWGVSRIDTTTAEGSFVTDRAGCTTSDLIGVDPHVRPGQPDPFLHSRVAGGVDAPSNLGPNSPELVRTIHERRATIAAREHVPPSRVPADAVTGSGSSLDPDISAQYAAIQVPRIARATGLTEQRVRAIVAAHTSGRQLGFLGEPRVDVPQVNRDLVGSAVRGVDAARCR